MKNLIKIIISFALVIFIAILAAIYLLDSMDWDYVSSKKSPSGQYGLYLYNYQSDGDTHAPYGQYIFFHPEYRITKPIKSDVIFAGYCKGGTEYSWASDMEINITCQAQDSKNIRTQSNKIFGIKVNVHTQ
ncbi:MAG: hypothetical protein ACJAUJ_001812 [Salibacteraceae bacterium]